MSARRNHAMKILLTADQRRMLEWLAGKQRRSMNDVVRLAIERVYASECLARGGTATGSAFARGKAFAQGKAE